MKALINFPFKRHVAPLWLLPGVGALVGLAFFSVAQLTGMPLFIWGGVGIGGFLGVLSAFLARKREALVLTEMTVSIPEFSEWKFVVNSEYRQVAWKVFVEVITRVATQPLDSQSGSIREALTSLYSLFGTVRELLKNTRPTQNETATSVELLAVKMLNREIRPYLAKWHPLLRDHEKGNAPELTWDRAGECRRELEDVRARLQTYARAFGELAQVRQLDRFFER